MRAPKPGLTSVMGPSMQQRGSRVKLQNTPLESPQPHLHPARYLHVLPLLAPSLLSVILVFLKIARTCALLPCRIGVRRLQCYFIHLNRVILRGPQQPPFTVHPLFATTLGLLTTPLVPK